MGNGSDHLHGKVFKGGLSEHGGFYDPLGLIEQFLRREGGPIRTDGDGDRG